jgi:hypothetical protein
MMTGGFPADQRTAIGYSDDKYYAALMKIVDIYVNHFGGFKPVVLQLGSGANGSADFMRKVANDVADKYGNQVWLKYNGWSEAINAELVAYPWANNGYWRTVTKGKIGFQFTNSKARNIKYAKVKMRAVSETVNRNLKMVIYKDNGGKIGEKWAESEVVPTDLGTEGKVITFNFPQNKIYLSYKYWIEVEGLGPGEGQIELVADGTSILGEGDEVARNYTLGTRINWEMTQVFVEGLYVHELLASLATKTRVGFEPGQYGTGNQSYPVQNSAEVIYRSIMETVDPSRKSNFYVPISYLCLQNDYYAKSGITRSQFKIAADLIRINASRPVGMASIPVATATNRPTIKPTPTTTLTPRNLGADANGDGKIDGGDFSIWRKEYYDGIKTGGRWAADFNGDNIVDWADLEIWKIAYLK